MEEHEAYMRRALELAREAAEQGEVPVGCVIVQNGRIIGEGRNCREEKKATASHAEMESIAQANAAAQTGGYSSSYGTQAGQNAYTTTMNNLDNVLNSLQDQSRSEYTAKRTGLESRLSGLQNAEQQDYQNYQKDMANWMDGLQYRQNEYDKASSESSQRTSRWLNGILSAVQLAAQILPFFFV